MQSTQSNGNGKTESTTTTVDPFAPLVDVIAARVAEAIGQRLDDWLEEIGATVDASSPVMTRAEAARYLRVSLAQLDRLCRERGLPNHRLGDVRRFDREELRAWLKAGSR